MMRDPRKVPLYERFAQDLEDQVRSGTFPVGARVPSIRESSVQQGVSFSTVLQAYRLLENRGVIEARPQSGYYVRLQPKKPLPEPDFQSDQGDPSKVSIDEVSLQLIHDNFKLNYAQFGAASPNPELLPTVKLNRILAELARDGKISHDMGVDVQGNEALRIQVAQRAFSYGCELSPAELVVTAGCTEAMNLCLQAVCQPGDLVAIESPTYFGILLALEAQHLRVLEIPSHPRTGMSLEALEFALENHPIKAVVAIPNFSNPTGSLIAEPDKADLVRLLARHQVPLIENDINGELYFGERRPRPAKSFDRDGLVMLCSSFSKDISAGFRIGWVAPGRFYREVQSKKYALNMRTSVLPQLAIARFLESGGYDQHLRKIRRAYAEKTSAMSQAILAHFPEGTRITEPGGGFVLWVQLPERLDSLRLYREAMKAFIAIAPGYLFSPTHKFDDFIRLNASCWSERSEQDLTRLGMVAKRLLSGGGAR
ncbi:MAG: PLP-dependent aminotransferase family protein [Holophaga sp.]|nr:PLP-dependent aminotransferase family protein [Holophaga sp.]